VLFDELEERLKGSTHQTLIKDLFEGLSLTHTLSHTHTRSLSHTHTRALSSKTSSKVLPSHFHLV